MASKATNTSSSDHKGILKKNAGGKSSSGTVSETAQNERRMKWDEMNILATYHPSDKDYGHMKIDDPPTPFHREEDHEESLDASAVAKRLTEENEPTVCTEAKQSEKSEQDEDGKKASDVKSAFEQKRKMHYNEFQAIKLARKLMEDEDEDDEEDTSVKSDN